jgi:1,4-dihydroxy-2-naphthoate octaprenyltransferase
MPLVRVYFRLIYIFVATIMIFAASMLQVENNYFDKYRDYAVAK